MYYVLQVLSRRISAGNGRGNKLSSARSYTSQKVKNDNYEGNAQETGGQTCSNVMLPIQTSHGVTWD